MQKSIKKCPLDEEYLTIFPLPNGKNNFEKQKIKILKDSKGKKFIKKKNNKCNEDKFKSNNFKIKKIIPLNINNFQNKQLRNVNSCYGKKINKIINNYQNEQLLNTISNNNKKIDIYNNFKNNCTNFTQNKNIYSSNKRIFDEKLKKSKELSFNSAQDNNSIKNILSVKNSRYLKNKYTLQNSEINNDSNIRDTNINYQIKKNKPMTARIKLNLKTEGNKKNSIKNNPKNNINNNDNIQTKSNKNSSAKRIIYFDSNNFKNLNTRPLIYYSLSPNCQSIKQLIDKTKISNIKEIYSNINNYNQGRNTYNSSQIHNKSNNFNNNNIINSNINNKIIIKKIKKENIKNNRSNNIAKSMYYYNIENMSQYSNPNLSPNHKKIIAFNNITNYNISNTNHTINNLTHTKERPNNTIFKNTIEILSPFTSINNKKNNNSHKKFYVNKQNNDQQGNNNRINLKDKKNISTLEQNIIYMDNSKIKNSHTFNGINCPNKYLYNKNLIYKLNCNDNFNHNNININNSQLNYNIRINNNVNNYIHFSNSNDKERNTISNKSYGTIYLNKNQKDKNSKEKNITLEILDKNQKNLVKKGMPSIQELNNKF